MKSRKKMWLVIAGIMIVIITALIMPTTLFAATGRTREMECYQVWVNKDNNFEFVFWWPYANNNWVRIYDMSGKEVYSIDMPYNDPHFIAKLPDGMYTVKTFTIGRTDPIQTFIIGKDPTTPKLNIGHLDD